MNDYEEFDGLGLAALVQRGEVSPAELIDAAERRLQQRNPTLNAVVTPLFDSARAALAALPAARPASEGGGRGNLHDRPFAGVPFLVKELVASVAGSATTSASKLYAGNVAAADSEVVVRLRRAGVAIVGKTNSSEFGLSPATESALYGVTRNPWRPALSPGGSSGGSAAAVAAGIVPLAHATDGGGSIRIPASCCGLFGLKPTRARISAGPEGGEGLSGLAMQHVVSRSVRDSAAMLDALAGPLAGDPYVAPPPARPWRDEVGAAPGRLRIGFARRAPNGAPLHADCLAAVDDAAALCAALGHEVDESSPEADFEVLRSGFGTVFAAHTMANVGRANGGRLPARELLEPLTYALAERGAAIGAAEFIAALHALHRQSRRIAGWFDAHDLWLTPTLAQPPQPIGAFETASGDVDRWLARIDAFLPFTYPFNVTGQPAMSVPLYWSAEGLPIGVQFAARYGDEAMLFRLAGQLERARPWFGRRPPAG